MELNPNDLSEIEGIKDAYNASLNNLRNSLKLLPKDMEIYFDNIIQRMKMQSELGDIEGLKATMNELSKKQFNADNNNR